MFEPFFISQMRPAKSGLTISRPVMPDLSWFSMGKDTSISPETYDTPILYLAESGSGSFLLSGKPVILREKELLFVPTGTLCGSECSEDFIYTEMILSKENLTMNELVTPGIPLALKDLLEYEADSIANLDIVRDDKMKFVVMAFDEGTGLTPHRAPGNAILTALEGTAVIGYEGTDYEVTAGQSFRFAKNGLHSVTPKGKFKMSLLLIIE